MTTIDSLIDISPYEGAFSENNKILIIGDITKEWEDSFINVCREYCLDLFYAKDTKEGKELIEKLGEFAVNVMPYTTKDDSCTVFYKSIREKYAETYVVIVTDIIHADEARAFFKIDSFAACMISPIRMENFSMMIKKLATKFNLVKREEFTIERLREKEIDLEIISVITKDIVSSLNFSKIINIVLDEIKNKLPVDKCTYFEIDNSDCVKHIESRGISEDTISKFPTGNVKDFPLSRYIVENKKEIYIEDTTKIPEGNIKKAAESANISSVAIFPVLFNEKVAGFLFISTLESEKGKRITPRLFTIIKRITELLSISLRNATKYRTVSDFNKELLQELKKTSEIGNIICSTLDFKELLKVSIIEINELIPCSAHTLIIADKITGRLSYNYGTGGGINNLLKYQEPDEIELARFVLRQKTPYVRNGMKAEEVLPKDMKMREKLLNVLPDELDIALLPVISRGEPLGVIISMNKNDGKPFDETDTELLSIIAAQIGIATENSILTEERKIKLQDTFIKLEQAQAQLFQSEKMAALGQLAGGVAHEINNPLTGVVTNLQLIDDLDKIDDEKCARLIQLCEKEIKNQESLSEIISSLEQMLKTEKKKDRWIETAAMGGKRCKHIVENLLVFSRQSKSEKYDFFNLNECIDQTLDIIGTQFSVKNVKIEKNLSQSLSKVYGNMGEISQVILNLLINAFQAIKQKSGTITVTTKDESKNFVSVSIADTGSGISPEIREKIFEPFFTTKEVGVGTGLGLSIVHGIIEKHGGLIDIESEPGKGTTFIIRLPVEANTQSEEMD